MKKTVWLLVFFLLMGYFNKVNSQPMNILNDKQQKIVTIAANTAIGDMDALKTEMAAGLSAGLTVNEIKEIVVQMYAYTGFPRSLNGINALMQLLDERKAANINDTMGAEASAITDTRDKYVRGREVLEKLTLTDQKNIQGANAFAPAIDRFLKEHLFADIFERDVLTHQQRELATVSALAAMQGVEPQLGSHRNMAKNTGLTDAQIHAAVFMAAKIGSDYRDTKIFPLGNRGSSEWFTGEVYVQGLLNPDKMENLYSVGQVTFMPGGRTHWHTHPIGQTLLVLDGNGWYQEQGKPAVKLEEGSVVAIPKDVIHWHGASKADKLVHIAISNVKENNNVTWMTAVTDEEFSSVHQ